MSSDKYFMAAPLTSIKVLLKYTILNFLLYSIFNVIIFFLLYDKFLCIMRYIFTRITIKIYTGCLKCLILNLKHLNTHRLILLSLTIYEISTKTDIWQILTKFNNIFIYYYYFDKWIYFLQTSL